MKGLDELLDDEYRTPEANLYFELAEEDEQLLGQLIEIRRSRMTQAEVAAKMGVTQATVSAFERLGNDPRMSTVRRYAGAVGVMVRHYLDAEPHACEGSAYLSHVSISGIATRPTAAATSRQLAAAWPLDDDMGIEEPVRVRVDTKRLDAAGSR